MPRTLYSPRLSDDVVRSLYHEAKRRGMPMTRLADLLLREALARGNGLVVLPDPTPSPSRNDLESASELGGLG